MRRKRIKDTDDGEPKVKASWENYIVRTFCDICLREIANGNRPGTYLNRKGWKNVIDNFAIETGRVYDRRQLKNKWDQLKKDWKLWKQLLENELSVKWDASKNTIDAPNFWWQEKLMEIPDARKFRSQGIEPELEEKLDRMFMFPLVTEDYSLELDDAYDSALEQTPPKRRAVETSRRDGHPVTFEITATPFEERSPQVEGPSRTDHFRDGIESRSRSTATSIRRASESCCSITEAIHLLDSIEEIPKATLLYYFATKLILDRDKREVFMALGPETRVWWLKMAEEESRQRGK